MPIVLSRFVSLHTRCNRGAWHFPRMISLCPCPHLKVYFSADFPRGGPFGDYFAATDLDKAYSGMNNLTNGFHRGKYLMNPNTWVKSCETSKGDRSLRLALLIMLGTPYCIGFLVAFLLNLILPEDDEEPDVNEVAMVCPSRTTTASRATAHRCVP